jgi:hypothetical protein
MLEVLGRSLDWFAVAAVYVAAVSITLWIAGAIYFVVCNGSRAGRWIAGAFCVGVFLLFAKWGHLWQPLLVLLGLTALFLHWRHRQKPSQNRDWEPAVAVLANVVRDGDKVTIHNVRNFDYRTLDDFTPRYESRTYNLTNLVAADVIFFNWGSALMSHPLLVFDFGSDGRVCVSIEVRYQRGQKYSILRSIYHYFELIFLVSDERDAILRRTKYGPRQEAHLYRIVTTPQDLRETFLDYVDAINALYQTPRWYHGLCMNCTTTFYQLPSRRKHRKRCDWRVLANARLDRALYAVGKLDQTLPFAELRRCAYLNDIANQAPVDGFGDYVRRELERRRHDR